MALAAAHDMNERSKSPQLLDATMFWSAAGGGVRRYLLRKREWLRQRGWRHTLIAPAASQPDIVDCGGWSLPFSGGYRLPLRREQAALLIARQGPDLIEAGDPYRLAWAALDAAQRLGVPAVAFCHSNLGAMAACLAGRNGVAAHLARRTAQIYLRHVYRQFDRVFAPSAAMAGELQDLGIERVERQPLGVDSRVFHPCRRDPAWRIRWQESLGLPPGARLLLYTGRFAPEKNLPLLVAALERVGPPYFLLAVGAGPQPPRGERIRVLAHEERENELARIYASVDGFLHAGDQETFGLSALEAMASGTPLAVRAAAGLAELVGDDTGVAVASASVEAWAEAIAALFDSGREARAGAARRRAETFDWGRVLPRLLGRYQSLLGNYRVLEARTDSHSESLVA